MLPTPRWIASAMTLLVSINLFAQSRAFSVRDDIAMARFSDLAAQSSSSDSDMVKPSPDGQYYAVVTTKGLLGPDLIESDINLFSREQVETCLSASTTNCRSQPRVIARLQSFPHREEPSAYAPVIMDVRWAQDQRHLYFRGENLQGNYQLYEAAIDGTSAKTLTAADRSVDQFDVAKNTIAYTVSIHKMGEQELHAKRDAIALTGQRLQDVLFPGGLRALAPEDFSLVVLQRRDGRWQQRSVGGYSVQDIPYLSFLYPFALSPAGDRLITLMPMSTVPGNWKRYTPAPGYESLRFGEYDSLRTSTNNLMRPRQYSLVDLGTGRVEPIVDAPNARTLAYLDVNLAAWSYDESRVLVTNTFLPLAEDPAASDPSAKPCIVALIDISTRDANCLASRGDGAMPDGARLIDVAFGKDKNEAVLLTADGTHQVELRLYRFAEHTWHPISSQRMNEEAIDLPSTLLHKTLVGAKVRLCVHEDLNSPPTLWAQDVVTERRHPFWDPNPQLAQLKFGEASEYHWKDRTGYQWTGALVKPVGFVPGKRYPFVIQMYSFHKGQFLTDGTDPTAFAARQLAGVGFIVLQIQKKKDTLSAADPRDSLEGYRSAIDSLSKEGLIDRTRGGVIGFSWTYWYVVNALTKDPSLFAAATVADGIDNSYFQYQLLAEGSYPIRHQMERIYGSAPLGSGLNSWLENAPSFHLDQVRTPLRMEASNPLSVLGEWDLYASLRLQTKPVDLIYFPKGTHIHQRPLERLESQQGDVDWFRFWLQNYEDPDPSKRDQYLRWNQLKQSQDAPTAKVGQR